MVRLAFLAVALVSVAQAVFASDGILEINQACATSSVGCFPGDTGGFPVTITQAGSYRLTSNLTNSSNDVGTIQMRANLVDLDLNGFTIGGPAQCSADGTVHCTNTGSADHISGTVIPTFGNAVRNGTLYGAPRWGIWLGSASRVENVQVLGAGRTGIEVGEGSRISNCVMAAAEEGIVAPSSLVFDCVIRDVGSDPSHFAVTGRSGLAITRNLHLFRITGNAYFQNVRSVGTSYCDANAC
jgi:hypothetical protein